MWACLIGIDALPQISWAANSIRFLAQTMTRHHHIIATRQERTCTMPPPPPTRRRILAGLRQTAQSATPDSILLVYLLAPGIMDGPTPYLAPTDIDTTMVADTGIAVRRVGELMSLSKAHHKLLWMDFYAPQWADGGTDGFLDEVLAIIPPEIDVIAGYTPDLILSPQTERTPMSQALLAGMTAATEKRLGLAGLIQTVRDDLAAQSASTQIASRTGTDFPLFTFSDSDINNIAQNRKINPLSSVFPAAVQSPQDFFDRESILAETLHTLQIQARPPIVIQGERGMGKTSLLLRVEHALQRESGEEDRRWLSFYITPGRLDRWEHFAWELLDGLELALSVLGTPPAHGNVANNRSLTFNWLVTRVNRLINWGLERNPGLSLVVLMDEIDKGGIHPDVLEKILASIHYLVEKTDLPLFFLMTIITRILPEPARGSPLPTKLIRLHPLAQPSLDEMIRALARRENMELPWADFLSWLQGLSGGHPYLAKLLLSATQQQLWTKPGDASSIWDGEAVLQWALQMEEARQLLEDTYQRFFEDEEKAVILELAGRYPEPFVEEEVKAWPETYIRAVWQLAERGYLHREEEQYTFAMGFWPAWLRAWSLFALERRKHPIPGLRPLDLPPGICLVRATQRIYLDGKEIQLSGVPRRALIHLIEQRGKMVSKEELAHAMYPGEHFSGTDQQIDITISRIRKALGDKRPRRYLHTQRGSGYRLEQATVLEEDAPDS